MTGSFDPFFDAGERGCPRFGRFVILNIRELNRQVRFRYWHYGVLFAINFTELIPLSGFFFLLFAFFLPTIAAIDDGNWFSPIMLARENPVAKFVIHGLLS